MDKSGIGVIIARFQTPYLHEGHKALIDKVLERHDKVMVLLGVTPALATPENPLDYVTRRVMVVNDYPEIEVQALSDKSTDEEWSSVLDSTVRRIFPIGRVTLYGGRDSFASHYSGNFEVREFDGYDVPSMDTSATQLRKKIANSKPLGSRDFREGVIYSCTNRYPICFPTVDVAVIKYNHDGEVSVLLGTKHGLDTRHVFIGGFVDAKDKNYEAAASRELLEETNSSIGVSTMKYFGSYSIDDVRYKGQDKIKTMLFTTKYQFGHAVAGDDLSTVEWVPLNKSFSYLINPMHLEMFEDLCDACEGGKF